MIEAPPFADDYSALEELCAKLRLLIEHDPRRGIEADEPFCALRDAGKLAFEHPLELAGGIVVYFVPSPRFVALFESLRLRSRLNLPTGEVPT